MNKSQTTSRTSKSKFAKRSGFPKWVVAVVLLLIAGTGLYMVYNSFAAGPSIRTIYCRQGTCWNVQMSGSVAKSAYTRTNYACGGSLYLEYKIVGAKTSWNCLITGA